MILEHITTRLRRLGRRLRRKHKKMETVEELSGYLRDLIRRAREATKDGKRYDRHEFHNEFMDSEQFELLGAGCFGIVWRHHITNLAVKIGGFMDYTDDGYPDYARFCMENRHLKYLPNVMVFEEFGLDYFAIMPVYKPRGNHVSSTELYFMSEIIWDERINPNWQSHVPTYRVEGMIETCRALHGIIEGNQIDLHGENVMVDEMNEPVITDPFSYKRAKKSTPKPASPVVAKAPPTFRSARNLWKIGFPFGFAPAKQNYVKIKPLKIRPIKPKGPSRTRKPSSLKIVKMKFGYHWGEVELENPFEGFFISKNNTIKERDG